VKGIGSESAWRLSQRAEDHPKAISALSEQIAYVSVQTDAGWCGITMVSYTVGGVFGSIDSTSHSGLLRMQVTIV
jgi:hypothetical protein